jgi:hypothetical protein
MTTGMNPKVVELVAMHLAFACVDDVSPERYWGPQLDYVKDNYRAMARELIATLRTKGYEVVDGSRA